jgi:hypothetical protein
MEADENFLSLLTVECFYERRAGIGHLLGVVFRMKDSIETPIIGRACAQDWGVADNVIILLQTKSVGIIDHIVDDTDF